MRRAWSFEGEARGKTIRSGEWVLTIYKRKGDDLATLKLLHRRR